MDKTVFFLTHLEIPYAMQLSPSFVSFYITTQSGLRQQSNRLLGALDWYEARNQLLNGNLFPFSSARNQ